MGRPRKDLTEEEQTKLRRALSDYDGINMLKVVNGSPKYHYFFAAKSPGHPQSVQAMQHLGYEIVNRENNDGEQLPYGVVDDAEHGAIQTQELVLMRLPKYLKEARDERAVEIAEERAAAARMTFDEAAENASKNAKVFIFGEGRSSRRS